MANKFKEKQMMAEILNELYEVVQSKEDSCKVKYEKTGKLDVQDTHWKTGELLWEDEAHTIPKMKSIWEYVPKSDDEMSEDDKLRIKMCQYVKTQLEKMI